MPSTNNHIDTNDDVQGLIDSISSSPEKYSHLQIFLSRVGIQNCFHDNMFLMISPKVFGKVKVLDLTIEGDFIIVEFLDCAMQEHGNIRINISDEKPSALFICWQDIKKMVLDETSSIFSNDELLEFCF